MKKVAVVLIALVLASLFIYSPISSAQTVLSQAIPTPYLNVTETNQTVIIKTTYNELIINKKTNSPSVIYATKNEKPALQVNPKGLPAIDVLYVSDGSTLKVNWTSYQVIQRSPDLVEADFTGTVGDSTLTLRIIMGSFRPYIDIVLTAPSGPTMYYLVVPVNESIADLWTQAISYYSGASLTIQTTNVTLMSTGLGLDAIALLGLNQANNTNTLKFIAGYSNLPGYVSPAEAGGIYPSDLQENPYNATSGYILLTAAYPGGTPVAAGVRLVLTGYDPYAILAAGLEEPIKNAYPGAAEDFKVVVYTNELIDQFNKSVNLLKERLSNLTKENENLTKTLAEYQGCESYWKNEVKVRDYQIERLTDRIQKEGAISIAAFFIGALLGVIGGYYVLGVQKKVKITRRRR
ncbi:MAG: hypothetical protein F7C82_01195 [Desulfurococcales archaeon]|nr:hypothetical protein [Desulfurococcales archaeon]